jgi:hypothetical protein
MDANHVGSLYPNGFGSFQIAGKQNVSLASTGDVTTLVAQPATKYIVRRITLSNFSGNASAVNVQVTTTSGVANATTTIVAAATLGANAANTNGFVDLTLAAQATANVQTAKVLYANVIAGNTAVTCDIALYGDIVAL